jgi:hypothetical protein
MFDRHHPLFQVLRNGYYHATSIEAYRAIRTSGCILPNYQDQFNTSFPQSRNSCCRQLNAISLFDFQTPSLEDIFDEIVSMQWSQFLYRWKPITILIGLNPVRLDGDIISNDEARAMIGLYPLIKDVEVCYPKPIHLDAVVRYILICADHLWRFKVFDTQVISDEQIHETFQYCKQLEEV